MYIFDVFFFLDFDLKKFTRDFTGIFYFVHADFMDEIEIFICRIQLIFLTEKIR